MAKTKTTPKKPQLEVKFTVTITKDGFSKKLTYDDKTYTEEWKKTKTGATCLSKNSISDHKEIPEEIADMVDSLDSYNVMSELETLDY